MYADFIYAQLYMGCGYPTIDINYVNYTCIYAISVLLGIITLCSHKITTSNTVCVQRQERGG